MLESVRAHRLFPPGEQGQLGRQQSGARQSKGLSTPCIHRYVYICVYIYEERERERQREMEG